MQEFSSPLSSESALPAGIVGHTGGAEAPLRAGLSPEFSDWLERARTYFESELAVHLAEIESAMGPHSRLAAAVVYSAKLGGKRLRPILVLETCRVCGGPPERALAAAFAAECIHTFSLIHDDLPAMDNDDLRRGEPTNHKVFGEGMAVLAGDWLVTHAFALLASDRHVRAAVPALLQALADGTKWMIDGQAADVDGEKRPTDPELVQYIHQHKTAALIETCCRLGAICAGASTDALVALARYGRHLGLAFQIMDDVLDLVSTGERMGKRVGKDAVAHKQTYPAAFGLEVSKQQAWHEVESALRAIDSFGGRANRLRDLARYVVTREK